MATAIAPLCDETAGVVCEATDRVNKSGVLVATVLGSSLAFVVGAIINVALPSMQRDFGTASGVNNATSRIAGLVAPDLVKDE